jgi:hypothetical protein
MPIRAKIPAIPPQRPATLKSQPSAIFGAPISHFRKYNTTSVAGQEEAEIRKTSPSFSMPKAQPRCLVYRPAFPGPADYRPHAVLSRRPEASILPIREASKGHWWRPSPGADVYGHAMPMTLQRFPMPTIGNAKRVTGLQATTAAPPKIGPGRYETSWGVGDVRKFGTTF